MGAVAKSNKVDAIVIILQDVKKDALAKTFARVVRRMATRYLHHAGSNPACSHNIATKRDPVIYPGFCFRGDAMRFHKSKQWERKRLAILRRDRYLCQEAKRYGRSEPAKVVHHIYPVEDYPELGLIDWNLISLSEGTHNLMHDRMTGEITALGRQWQQRRHKEFEELYSPPLLGKT